MTFTLHCMTNQLAAALAAAGSVVDHGIKYPILKATRIHVHGGAAIIIATNTDQAIRVGIAADGEGVAHFDTVALTSKISALQQTKPVAIEGDGNHVTISQGRTKWKLPVLKNDAQFDFEASAGTLDGTAIEISAGQLFAAFSGTRPAYDTGEVRYFLHGPLVEFIGGALRLIGTDGNILAVVQLPGEYAARDGFIMPLKSVVAIPRLFDPESVLRLVATENAFTLTDGETLFRSKMIEGTYPDWRRVLPKSTGTVEVDGAEFLAAIERVATIKEDIGKASKFVPVTMVIGESEIEFTSKNQDGEEGTDFCACERTAGGDYHVVVSADTAVTALRAFGAVDGLRLRYGGATKAAKVGVVQSPLVVERALSDGDDYRLINTLIDSKGDI